MSLLILVVFLFVSVNGLLFNFTNSSSLTINGNSRVARSVTDTTTLNHPSVVLIKYKTSPVCTGNLVTLYLVLTTATCAFQGLERRFTEDFQLLVGYNSYESAYGESGSKVSYITLHPEFVCCYRNDHDLALFQSITAFTPSDKVNTIQLSTTPLGFGVHQCEVTGYGDDGRTFFSNDRYISKLVLKVRHITITKQCKCNRFLKKKHKFTRKPFICSNFEHGESYEFGYNDRGSGLICENKMYGLFALMVGKDFMDGCSSSATTFQAKIGTAAAEKYTVAFTDLCLSLRWINRHTKTLSEKQVNKRCGAKYVERWKRMNNSNKPDHWWSNKGTAARSLPSFLLLLTLSSKVLSV